MKQVYAPANAAEAHMLAHLLDQNGIRAHIHGEGLQAAVGELPAASLLQLLVADEDYDRARALILAWERASPPTQENRVRSPKRFWMIVAAFAIGVLIGWMLKEAAALNAIPIDIAEEHIDRNGDGQDDATYFYRVGGQYAYKGEYDRNADGEVDLTEHYDANGVLSGAEADNNFDGFIENRTSYEGGDPNRTDIDSNRNGVADTRVFFRDGVISREEIDNNRTGRPARVNFYNAGRVTRSESDLDGDGAFETVRTYDDLGEITATETRPPQ